MSWWLRDKIAGAIWIGTGLVVGYTLTLLVGLTRSQRRAWNPRTSVTQFVRRRGFDASMAVVAAIAAAAFAGLIYGGSALWLLDAAFGIRLAHEGRFATAGIVAGAAFCACLFYLAQELLRDNGGEG